MKTSLSVQAACKTSPLFGFLSSSCMLRCDWSKVFLCDAFGQPRGEGRIVVSRVLWSRMRLTQVCTEEAKYHNVCTCMYLNPPNIWFRISFKVLYVLLYTKSCFALKTKMNVGVLILLLWFRLVLRLMTGDRYALVHYVFFQKMVHLLNFLKFNPG